MYWLYLGNFLNAFGKSIASMNHFWSLAIEEQFYLIWPLVVQRLSLRRLTVLCYSAIAVICVVRYGVIHFHLPGPEFVYTLTPLRCDGLLFGALLACLQESHLLERISAGVKWGLLAGICLLTVGVFMAQATGYVEPAIGRFGYPGADLVSASLVAAVLLWQGHAGFAVLRSGFFRFFGKYSYGIYVWHFVVSRYTYSVRWSGDPRIRALLSLLIGTCVSVGIALVSWNVLEKRCLAMKARFHQERVA